jgi:hypothetical protein
MKRYTVLVAVGISITVALFFQNCGSPAGSPMSYGSQSSNGGGNPPPSADPNNWNKGDAFDYSRLPANMQSQMVQTQFTYLNYPTSTFAKAIAISSDGLGFVKIGTTGVNQDQVNQIAKDGCYSITGGKPCSLIAVGNAWNIAKAALAGSFSYVLPAPTALTATSIPFLNPADASNAAINYSGAGMPKALAISLDGAYFSIASTAAEPVADINEATRLVLERCEMGAGYVPCFVFAQNNTIVFTPAALNRTPAIDYARTTVATNIPGIRQALYTSLFQNSYIPNVNGTTVFGAIYITADGVGGYDFEGVAATADTKAKANCTGVAVPAYPCFKYAVNKTIQPLAANLSAVKNLGTNLHCKAIPRVNCAAHKAMGCPAGGSYYTQQASGIALETCL